MKTISSNTDSIKVLIIEDEEAHFQLMKRAILKQLPETSVFHAISAAACLEELDTINPDIILVDYLLPDMTGIEFLATIKRIGFDIPVIMITGQGDEGIAVHAMKLGAKDYLVKNKDFFLLLPSVIEQVTREDKLKHNLWKVSRLNELLLDSLPYPAMMIRQDQFVLAANQIAQEMGVQIGKTCWKSFRFDAHSKSPQKNKNECSFCRIKEMFQLDKAINIPELTIHDRIWDIWWIPIDREDCLHYAIDITDRKRIESKLRISSRFLEVVNRHEDMGSLLQGFVHELKSITGCCAAAAWILNDQKDTPFIISEGCDPKLLVRATINRMNSDAELVDVTTTDETEPPITISECLSFAGAGSAQTLCSAQPTPWDFHSTALLPIHLEERNLGYIFLADIKEGMLPSETIEIATTAAMKLAIVVERIQSRKLMKKSEQILRLLSDRLLTAQEEERKKISRDLHDSVGSSLCAIRLFLSIALQGRPARKPIKKILSLTQETIDEVRRIMADLRPSFLDNLGIIAALDCLVNRFSETHPGIGINQQVEIEEHEVPESIKIVILRIVQESFNNISKYSQADSVTLKLVKKEDAILLSINDNGIGFNPGLIDYAKHFGTGIGLVSMKERTELSGGTFILKSREGKGTTITASWPLFFYQQQGITSDTQTAKKHGANGDKR
jgi:signal transduction histidine kinase/FixJ family two-component response regulator